MNNTEAKSYKEYLVHITTFIFDVDGVIADSEAVNVRATAKAFLDIVGIDGVRPKDFVEGIGRGAEEYVKAGARSHGRALSHDEVQRLVNARQENFLSVLREEPLTFLKKNKSVPFA